MGVSDGLGNDLSVEEVMSRHEKLAGIIARERATADAPYEDIRQELLISLWAAHEKKVGQRDDLTGLASVMMRRRANEVAQRQTWTGYESHRGRAMDPLRQHRESMDQVVEAMGYEVFGAVDALEGVEWAYHHGEILQVLAGLPEEHRRYVELRFWHGRTSKEAAAEMGYKTHTVELWWSQKIRPVLRERLTHLALQY